MHMGKCAKGRFGAGAHKAMLYEIVNRLAKIKQAKHDILRVLRFILPWFGAHRACGDEVTAMSHGIFLLS